MKMKGGTYTLKVLPYELRLIGRGLEFICNQAMREADVRLESEAQELLDEIYGMMGEEY